MDDGNEYDKRSNTFLLPITHLQRSYIDDLLQNCSNPSAVLHWAIKLIYLQFPPRVQCVITVFHNKRKIAGDYSDEVGLM